jgi:hypothetical protein
MIKFWGSIFSVLLLSISGFGQETKSPPLDIVFIVDISSSTTGLLSSVRNNFWEINNDISRLKPEPDYRIGLMLLGRPSFKEENAYIKIASDLTTDIDYVANEMFTIKDNATKGKVYFGNALKDAVNEFSWSKDENAIKLIFLVGNGPLSNGYDYRKAAESAVKKGIKIFSLYFPNITSGRDEAEWRDLAEVGNGTFANILLNAGNNIVFEKSYHNDLLVEANSAINNTYIYYGENGKDRFDTQERLDVLTNSVSDWETEARSFLKGTKLYQGKNYTWDLVDLANKQAVNYAKIDRKFLPPKMEQISDEDLKTLVEDKISERQEYISIIKMLSQKREEFLKRKKDKLELFRYNNTFLGVVKKTIIQQAVEKGYTSEF